MSDTPRTEALIARHTAETAALDNRDYPIPTRHDWREHSLRQAAELVEFTRQLERELSARSETQRMIPEGWQLVPKNPTEAMVRAAHEQTYVDTKIRDTARIIRAEWRVMLKAAPEAPK